MSGFNGDVLTPELQSHSYFAYYYWLGPKIISFFRVCTHERADADAKCSRVHTHAQKHTRSYICAHTPRLIMKFHSSPVWKFFLIKFHLLQLGFHHPITGRRAEALIHAWFHQAPGEYQSMPPILFYFSPSFSYLSLLFSRPLHAPLYSPAT